MKTAKGWRQLKKEIPEPELTLDDLYKYLTELFHGTPDNPRRLGRQNIVGYTREDGTEMIRHEGPDVWGGAMPVSEYNKLMEDAVRSYFNSGSTYFVKHDPYKDNPDDTPIISTKVTLDHGIEVTITYDPKDDSSRP